MLRRGQDVELVPDVVESAGVRMDVERHEVSVNGERVRLALKEFELLEMLLRNAGRVMTRGQLIDRIWGADYVGDTKTLDVHVKRLRTKIEPDPANPQLPGHRPRPGLQVRGLSPPVRKSRVRFAPGSEHPMPESPSWRRSASEDARAVPCQSDGRRRSERVAHSDR